MLIKLYQPYMITCVTHLGSPKGQLWLLGVLPEFESHFLIEWLFLFQKSDNINNISFITFLQLSSPTVGHIYRKNMLSESLL